MQTIVVKLLYGGDANEGVEEIAPRDGHDTGKFGAKDGCDAVNGGKVGSW